MNMEFQVLPFTGFYQGLWDQSENEYRETHEIKYGEYEDIEGLQYLDDWGFVSDYRDHIAKLYADEYQFQINRLLGVDLKVKGQAVDSPRYYNFTTDRIFVEFEIEDYEKFVNKLIEIASKPEYKTKIAKIIHDNHTSRDGFISFMSNDIEEWFEEIKNPDNGIYTSHLVGYILYAIDFDSMMYMNDSVYITACEQGLHETEPQTEEAKDEWKLYLKYRETYTQWTKQHPIRYPGNPDNRLGRWVVEEWDEYKENFLKYAKANHYEPVER